MKLKRLTVGGTLGALALAGHPDVGARNSKPQWQTAIPTHSSLVDPCTLQKVTELHGEPLNCTGTYLGSSRSRLPSTRQEIDARHMKNGAPGKAETWNLRRPHFGRVPYGVGIVQCSIPGKLALTYDDGPYIYTSELLDLLSWKGARATFFTLGVSPSHEILSDESSGSPYLIRRMIAEGHQVGSHTFSHPDLTHVGPYERRDEFLRLESELASILGFIPTYFRPPYGHCCGGCYRELAELGYHVVMWGIDTRDWEDGGWQSKNIFASDLADTDPDSEGWIVLAHDIHERTVRDLSEFMIDRAYEMGYELTTVGECLGDPPKNWYRSAITGRAVDPYEGWKRVPMESADLNSNVQIPRNTRRNESESSFNEDDVGQFEWGAQELPASQQTNTDSRGTEVLGSRAKISNSISLVRPTRSFVPLGMSLAAIVVYLLVRG